MVCQEKKWLLEEYRSAGSRLAALTAPYDARPQAVASGVPLASLLAARVAYDDAATSLEAHERQHGCGDPT